MIKPNDIDIRTSLITKRGNIKSAKNSNTNPNKIQTEGIREEYKLQRSQTQIFHIICNTKWEYKISGLFPVSFCNVSRVTRSS